jgi:CMP/dCMP kinase
MIIAIDGPAASGKSTTARLVAERLGFSYLDTGAMYRAVAWYLQLANLDPASDADLEQLFTNFHYRLEQCDTGERHYVNDTDVTDAIRTPLITACLGKVTPVPPIRHFLVQQQRELAAGLNVVLDGRDIGTVVFPQAELKVFLVASLQIRAQRRAAELHSRGWEADLEEIEESIAARDRDDSERSEGPLRRAEDAIELDSSNLTIDEQVEAILQMVRKIHSH